MAKFISCAETAVFIRKALKESFPGIKFSVRSSTYSGGASINVGWIDGPNEAQVKAVAGVFTGAYFDGMTDYKGSTYALVDGERVSFGADFIFYKREYSDASIERAIAGTFGYYGVQREGASVEDFRRGRLYNVRLGSMARSVQEFVWQWLAKKSDRLAVARSKTAGKVIYLGNDGYSDVGALSAEALS